MTNFDKAVLLINTKPLPDDAEEQLDKLARTEPDPFDQRLIEELGEALFIQRYPLTGEMPE